MKKYVYLFLLAAVMMAFSGCKTEQNAPDGPGSQKQALKYAAINVYNNTKGDADMLVTCTDGSYMVCELDHDGHGGYIYLNTDRELEVERGIYIFIDSTGTPTMLRSYKNAYFFKNVTENSCDIGSMPAGYQDKYYFDETSYYWDVQLTDDTNSAGLPRKLTAGEGNPFTEAFQNLVTEFKTFDKTWDVHMLKAAIPFVAKVASFGITAVSMISTNPLDWTSGITTLYQEAAKSGLVDDEYMTYVEGLDVFLTGLGTTEEWRKWVKSGKEGKFTPDGLGLSLLASALNEFADYGLANVNKFNERSRDMFSNKEYQIYLSTYRINASSNAATYTVKVSALLGWEMVTNPGRDWITVRPDYYNNELVIELKENNSDMARDGYIVVTPPSGHPEIAAATIMVWQEGVPLTLSPTSIVFDKDHMHNAIYVQTNSQVKEWHVVASSVPEWLSWEKGTTTVFLDVNTIYSFISPSKNGEVAIEATLADGSKIIKYCSVIWRSSQNAGWDGTSWVFTGPVTFNDGSSGEIFMLLDIYNVAANSASLTLMSTPNIPCSVSEDSSHRLKGTFGFQGMITGDFTITRSGSTAVCQINIIAYGDGAVGIGTGTLNGVLQ